MQRKRPYQQFKNVTVAPGAEWSLSVTCSFVRCHQSNQDEFEIGIDGDVPFSFREGDKYTLPDVDEEAHQVRIRNVGVTVLIVDMGFGFGDFSTDAIQFNGAIDVTTAANGFTTKPDVSVGLAAVLILPSSADRTMAIIKAGVFDLIIGPTAAVTAANGWTISQGDAFELNHRGEVWAIRAAGVADVAVYVEGQ